MTQVHRRFVLTGAPGTGKTTLLRLLAEHGYAVVDEAATDVIAAQQDAGRPEPWTDPRFTERIAELQRQRQNDADSLGVVDVFYDRSPVCTLALARFLGHVVGSALRAELDRIATEQVYDRRVFLVRPLGRIEPTAARRITYDASLAFERVHEDTYNELGYELIDVPAGPTERRVALVEGVLRRDAAARRAP